MSLRVKLTLAFFHLAIVPLSGIVLFSYESSRRVLRASNDASAHSKAEELDERMASIQDDLRRHFDGLEAVLLRPAPTRRAPMGPKAEARSGNEAEEQLVYRLLDRLADDLSPLIDSLEFVPAPDPPPAPVAAGGEVETTLAPKPTVSPAQVETEVEESFEIRLEGADPEEVESLAALWPISCSSRSAA